MIKRIIRILISTVITIVLLPLLIVFFILDYIEDNDLSMSLLESVWSKVIYYKKI